MVSSTRAGGGRGPDAYSRVSAVNGPSSGPTSSGNIKVVVRVRPENDAEGQSGKGPVIRVLDEHVLIFDPKEETSPEFYRGKRRIGRDLNKKKKRDVRFAFDRVLDDSTTNSDAYEKTTKLILDGLLDGYNCSVFAYGATGAGKTFTMLGNHKSPGVIFLTMMDLYKRIDEMKEDKICDVAVSYLEVYNEQIRDLLVPGKFLPIREDANKGVIITGLSLHKPANAQELLHMLGFGNQNRTQHPTDANAESSRSHAVFQVFVRQRDRTANISTNVRVAKMSLIDLAGSERATVTTNRGARFREGANINKSLLALGNCINALADGKTKGYVPYRNSKLTRLLKDSLGGNCRTVMIAAISPSASSFEDTYNTLNYANRAKKIKADVKRNVLSVDFHISQYAKIVDELRVEVNELRAKVKIYEEGELPSATTSTAVVPVNKTETDRMKGELVVVFEDRRNIRKEVMELEGSERDLAMKIHFKSRCLNRVQSIFTAPSVCEKIADRINRGIESTKRRQQKIVSRKHRILSRMEDNEGRLSRVHSEVTALGPESLEAELLESQVRNHHVEIEMLDTKRHIKHLRKVCRLQESQARNTEKLLTTVLQSYKQAYFILKGNGIATNDLINQFESIQQLVEGEREVAFVDGTLGTPVADQTQNETKLGENQEEHFDLNQIISMPVYSAVNLLTHTPRSGTPTRRRSYNSTRKTSVTMTPISCMKHATTPTLKPWNMSKLLATSNESTTELTPPFHNESHAIPCTPPGIQVSLPPKADILPVQLRDTPKISSVNDTFVLNSTFTPSKLDGIAPLDVSTDVMNTTVDLEKPTVETPLVPKVQSNVLDTTVTMTPTLPPRVPIPHIKEAWVDTAVGTPNPKNSRGINEIKELVSSLSAQLHGGGTVTKSTNGRAPVANGDTVTKSKPTVNSGTVTKSKDVTPPNGTSHSTVVRAIDFTSAKLPSPAGKLTFAEALKSPGRGLTRSISQPDPVISRSPLQSRENIPAQNKHGHGKDSDSGIPRKQRKVTTQSLDSARQQENAQHQPRGRNPNRLTSSTTSLRSRSALSQSRSSSNVQEELHRMGLPSAVDRLKVGYSSSTKPGYQQLTKSSAVKQSRHRRSLTADEMQKGIHLRAAPETKSVESLRATVKSLFKSRSKSSSQLPGRRGVFY